MEEGGQLEEEGEEQYEDDVLSDINPTTLLIQRTRTDDTFVGRLSKYVFKRLPSQDHILLTHHQEIAIYIRYHILPLLREILYDKMDRFFIWQAACIEYFKENDPEQITTRWSSFRNANWYTPVLDSHEQTESYILAMTDEFVTDTLADVEEMSSFFGSAWQFLRVRVFHVRYVKAGAHNLIRFGARPDPTSFHADISPLLANLVVDPQHFAQQTTQNACCVPISIILSILLHFEGEKMRNIGKKKVSLGLKMLNFQQFLQHSNGISISDFRRLESANTPLPLALVEQFPSIETYKGLALNLYRSVIRQDPDNITQKQIFIFPMVLSANHKSDSFVQVDLLLDSTNLRPKGRDSPTFPKSPLHVLTIHNLIGLLARNSQSKRNNATRYSHICRSCCHIFTSKEDLDIHRRYLLPSESANAIKSLSHHSPSFLHRCCIGFATGGVCKRRKAKNKKFTRLFRINSLGQKKKNGLYFKRLVSSFSLFSPPTPHTISIFTFLTSGHIYPVRFSPFRSVRWTLNV